MHCVGTYGVFQSRDWDITAIKFDGGRYVFFRTEKVHGETTGVIIGTDWFVGF